MKCIKCDTFLQENDSRNFFCTNCITRINSTCIKYSRIISDGIHSLFCSDCITQIESTCVKCFKIFSNDTKNLYCNDCSTFDLKMSGSEAATIADDRSMPLFGTMVENVEGLRILVDEYLYDIEKNNILSANAIKKLIENVPKVIVDEYEKKYPSIAKTVFAYNPDNKKMTDEQARSMLNTFMLSHGSVEPQKEDVKDNDSGDNNNSGSGSGSDSITKNSLSESYLNMLDKKAQSILSELKESSNEHNIFNTLQEYMKIFEKKSEKEEDSGSGTITKNSLSESYLKMLERKRQSVLSELKESSNASFILSSLNEYMEIFENGFESDEFLENIEVDEFRELFLEVVKATFDYDGPQNQHINTYFFDEKRKGYLEY